MLQWQLNSKILTLKFTWKISRNSTDHKTNFFVRVTDGKFSGTGEAAPNIRYGETPELLQNQFEELLKNGPESINDLTELDALLQQQTICNALRFALESAFVHFLSAKSGKTVAAFLGLPEPGNVKTCVSLPIMEPDKLPAFLQHFNLLRFPQIKIKVNQEAGVELVKTVAGLTKAPIWIDANEAWTNPDDLLLFLEKLKPYNIVFIEQPLPAALEDAYIYLKPRAPYPIFADESVTSQAVFDKIKDQFHGVNMKLMKAGGYRNGLKILEQTRALGLQTMVGCMVETSLGIWSALQLSHGVNFFDLDGFLIVKDEPFQLVKEENGILTPALEPQIYGGQQSK